MGPALLAPKPKLANVLSTIEQGNRPGSNAAPRWQTENQIQLIAKVARWLGMIAAATFRTDLVAGEGCWQGVGGAADGACERQAYFGTYESQLTELGASPRSR